MIKAIIVDDELAGRQNMNFILQNYFSDTVQVVGIASEKDEAIDLIKKTIPDLLFLDINLGEANGFDIIDFFDKTAFETIFITAYSSFAPRAFRSDAADYIMKPVSIDELKQAIEKVKERLEFKKMKETSGTTKEQTDDASRKLIIHTSEGIHMLPYQDILYLQSINYYTKIQLLKNKEIISSKHLKEYEYLLQGSSFFRIDNSYLVNVVHITNMQQDKNFQVQLFDGTALKVARRRKENFLLFLQSFDNLTDF
jgi:two-component system, LytTR family, response regulator